MRMMPLYAKTHGHFRQAAAAAAPVPETFYYDDDPYSDQKTNANLKDKVVLQNGMYNFYEKWSVN